ncbi:5'-methylthioadenosine/S-adenosylhomocysteine nucleosidase [Lipingzhangella sp. LS1_29]|uniref:5'-methylthioadenosine/S-adenosylhomocysteine nucleosidase n=1 Tax=Lipingzhangella rawalii TaxID=2055835 RepID=A0ABU2HAF2_9ACTN|nr:5'-methylthioadenosine/S-adenosylhomocysteine nucleosidase [Lipingzhangella rawalii]MDS1271830.1 5'-methylthioadenosine/S-adenosylhomocysteine nucleosidase [Lipingzhangella rawalii]
MTRIGPNRGVVNVGDNNNVSGNAFEGSTVAYSLGQATDPTAQEPAKPEHPWDIGVVTILAEEAQAIHDTLGLAREPGRAGGLIFHTGRIEDHGQTKRVVATRTHGQGQRSAMAACEHLRQHFNPRLLVLFGIGGGLDDIDVGDVVIGTRVVYYELRKEKPEATVRRGEDRETPAEIVHSVNAFFTDHGEPAEFPGQVDEFRERTFRALPSPIGSGEAVVADADSDIRSFLAGYNDKILALDMEAGGLSQFWQENSADLGHNPGWLVVRGISDNADSAKDDRHHRLAARNAAHVLRALLPYLP